MASASDQRPLSPHLSIWRWHATMAASILHRATGAALYVLAIALVAWLIALASGMQVYVWFDNLFHSWFGQLLLYGAFAVLAYHTANGVRHLVWDAGRALDPKFSDGTAWLVFLFTLAAPALLFVFLTFGAAR